MTKAPGDEKSPHKAHLSDLKPFRYFAAIAESGSISTAAAGLGLSQPSLSEFLKRLEADLGVRLIIRTGRGIELTEAGVLFASSSNDILERVERAVAEVRNFGNHPKGHVAIGMTTSLAGLLAVPLTETIQHEFGQTSIYVVEMGSWTMVGNVEAERLDFGLGYLDFDLKGTLYAQPLMDEEMFLLAAPDDWPAPAGPRGVVAEPVRLADLGGKDLILPNRISSWRRAVVRAADRIGVDMPPTIEIDSMSSMLSLVRRASAYAIAPQATAFRLAERGELVCVPIREPTITVRSFIIRKHGRPISQASLLAEETVAQLLREAIARHHLRADVLVGGPGR